MADIVNGNVFLVNADEFGKPPRIFSKFNRAERELLGHLRREATRDGCCESFHSITCVQIDTNATRTTFYNTSVKAARVGNKIILKIDRDPKGDCGCKARWSETLLLNLDDVTKMRTTKKGNKKGK